MLYGRLSERSPKEDRNFDAVHSILQVTDLIRMESLVLQSLGFRINTPTAYTFLSLLKQFISLPPTVTALAVYILVCHSPLKCALLNLSAPSFTSRHKLVVAALSQKQCFEWVEHKANR
jgi:hypothetical protein